jgi:NADH-quinone oxidoreductase subunit H
LEYNLVFASVLSLLFGYCIILAGYFSKSKYAFMGSIRAIILSLNLEIFLGLLMLNLVFLSESFCLSVFVLYQEVY